MKRFFYIFFSTLLAITVNAQSISVASFKMLPNDLTANTNGTEVLDQNGDKAALIKVVTTQTGFTFEGGALGITKVKQESGEVWVYVPKKSKKITIKHPQLGVLRDYYFPCAIEAARTYEMQLASGSVQTTVTQDAGGNFLAMKIVPPTASVYIDDKLQPVKESGQYSLFLGYGQHTYRVEAGSYKPQVGVATISETRSNVDVTLVSALSTLNVSCPTEGAQIYINDELKGTGSWNGTLSSGMYLVEARKDGYTKTIQNVQIGESETKTIMLPALVAQYGTIIVDYTPIDAEVYLDGKKLGTAPNQFKNILVGKYQLVVSKDGYQTDKKYVVIEEGKVQSINGELTVGASENTSSIIDVLQEGNDVCFYTVNGVTFEMVKVEGGTFIMGATPEQEKDAYKDEKPSHMVTINNYYIGKYEVTESLWKAVMGSYDSQNNGDAFPVEVTWDEYQMFISKLNHLTGKKFRLPTEAEWEFACRGGIKSNGYKYSGSNNINEIAWFLDNSNKHLHQVGRKFPNELKIYDMSGNAEEMCQDLYNKYSIDLQMNPLQVSSFGTTGKNRVIRGGAYSDKARSCRSTNRKGRADFFLNHFGFRLAISASDVSKAVEDEDNKIESEKKAHALEVETLKKQMKEQQDIDKQISEEQAKYDREKRKRLIELYGK